MGETNHWETRLDSTMLARYPKNMSVNQLASVFHFVELQHGDKNCEIKEAAAGFVPFLLDIPSREYCTPTLFGLFLTLQRG